VEVFIGITGLSRLLLSSAEADLIRTAQLR
jgi:hypothetical protein